MAVLPHLAFFLNYLIATLAGMWPSSGSPDEKHDAARATIEAFEPRDLAEAMLAARMIAAHHASMDAYNSAMQPGVSDADCIRLRNSAAVAGRSFDAALRLLEKRRAGAAKTAQPTTRTTAPTERYMTPEDSLVGFTPEEIAEAEYALDNDPIELARNELARRIPLDGCDDMTMEERRIAYAEQSDRTPAQLAVMAARVTAAIRRRQAEMGLTRHTGE
jgi:hypothetical protein